MISLSSKPGFKYSAIIPAIVTALCLIPFAGKAFHIDDPLFIWSAKHIHNAPADFYGFTVNWDGTEKSMAEVMHNPPLACYYTALAGLLFGYSEIALHTAFIVPAVAAALGIFYLAKQFCSKPVLAALAAVLTPALLVSGTNIMCDTMMVAFWVWAVVFWLWGIKQNKRLYLLAGSALIAACVLTKYFGIAVVGLLFVYSLMEKRKLGSWLFFLLIPVITLAAYQWLTHSLYSQGLISEAVSVTVERNTWIENSEFFSKALIGLTFTGGCIITLLFYIPLTWSRPVIVGIGILTLLFIAVLSFSEKIGRYSLHDINGVRWSFIVQLVLMAVAGGCLLAIAVVDFCKCRDAKSMLLLLWVIGTFIFVTFINWAVNARGILPMVPATGILIMRQIDRLSKGKQRVAIWRQSWPLVPALIVTMLVCFADYSWANTSRYASEVIQEKFGNRQNSVWFQGHWGFQYYMEANGHKAFDFEGVKPKREDIIIVPSNNSYTRPLTGSKVRPLETFQTAQFARLATMKFPPGGGFYADSWGPLPFAIGPVAPEEYHVFVVK